MQAQFFDLYRASMKSAADMMKTSLEQTERLQQQQLQMIRSALEDSTRSTAQLGEAKSLDDIMALNTRLAGAQLEHMTDFWSGLWRISGDTQKSMTDQMQSLMGKAKASVRENYDLTARTSESTAKHGASQVLSNSAQTREERKQEHRKTG